MVRVLFLILKLQKTEFLKVAILRIMNLGTPTVVFIEFHTARLSQTILTRDMQTILTAAVFCDNAVLLKTRPTKSFQ
jgi:hypothetical protein